MLLIFIDILTIIIVIWIIVTIIKIVKENKNLKKMKASGDPAQYLLVAQHYYKAEKFKDAIVWFEKAAQGGLPEAFYELSLCYDLPNSNIQNKEKAFQYCLEAAKQGVDKAQYRIGCCFENGIGTTKDLNEALHWFEEAMKNGNKLAALKAEKIKTNKE